MTTSQLTEQDIEEMGRCISKWRKSASVSALADLACDLIADLRRLRAENERLARERDEARSGYQWMVARAADQKLDGYRELGARAADAENRRDDIARQLTAATERAERAEATVRELRAAYGVSETQQEADRDQFVASVESATAEQIAAWIEQRAEAIGSGRDELTGSEAARELALYGAVEQIRAGAWRKEQP